MSKQERKNHSLFPQYIIYSTNKKGDSADDSDGSQGAQRTDSGGVLEAAEQLVEKQSSAESHQVEMLKNLRQIHDAQQAMLSAPKPEKSEEEQATLKAISEKQLKADEELNRAMKARESAEKVLQQAHVDRLRAQEELKQATKTRELAEQALGSALRDQQDASNGGTPVTPGRHTPTKFSARDPRVTSNTSPRDVSEAGHSATPLMPSNSMMSSGPHIPSGPHLSSVPGDSTPISGTAGNVKAGDSNKGMKVLELPIDGWQRNFAQEVLRRSRQNAGTGSMTPVTNGNTTPTATGSITPTRACRV